MHRDGSGQKILDIEAARAEWRAAGRSPNTYPNKAEWDAWIEDLGELTHTYQNGNQLRRHATLKAHARGGTRKIVHNCTIVHNPQTGHSTYYPDRDHDDMLARAVQAGV